MKICKNCGTNNDDFAVYCTDCGILLDEKNTSVVQDELQSEKTAPVHGGAYEQKQEHKPDSEKHDSREPYKARPSENEYHSESYYPEYPVIREPSVSKGKVIIGLILGILFGGIVGIIFGVLALFSYGDYESAVARKDAATANSKADKIRKYNKVAWICGILGIILSVTTFFASLFSFFSHVKDDYGFPENILDFDNEISMDDDSFDSYFENGNEYPDFEGIVDISIN